LDTEGHHGKDDAEFPLCTIHVPPSERITVYISVLARASTHPHGASMDPDPRRQPTDG